MNSFVRMCFICLFLFLSAAKVSAQPDSVWSKTYGGIGQEDCNEMVITPEGDYVLVGRTSSFGPANQNIWLLRADANGDSVWSRTFGGNSADQGTALLQAFDGGFLVAGLTMSSGFGVQDMIVIKTDANGIEEWSHVLGTSGNEGAYSVVQGPDSSFYCAGIWGTPSSGTNFALVKISASGAVQWSRNYGGPGTEICNSVALTADGGLILGGTTNSFTNGGFDYWVLKTNANGDSLWSRNMGSGQNDFGMSIVQSSDGGFLIAGYADGGTGLGNQVLVFKLNSAGATQWVKGFGSPVADFCYGAAQEADGGYLLACEFAGNFTLIHLESDGDSLWSKSLGGAGRDACFAFAHTDGGNIAAAGLTDSYGAGSTDMWLVYLFNCANPIPRAPELVITPEGNNIRLSWSPVVESLNGCSINVTGYLLWYSPVTEGPYYFLDYTTDTTHVHTGVIAFASGMHYYAESYVGDPIALQSLPHDPVSRFTREQIQQMLNY